MKYRLLRFKKGKKLSIEFDLESRMLEIMKTKLKRNLNENKNLNK